MKKLFTNLTFWVLTAITAGALLGHYDPETAVKMDVLGKGFISIVKIFINPIIFLTITLGIIGMGDLKKVGKVGAKALLYFEIVTTMALIVGVLVANIIRPGDGVVTANLQKGDISVYANKVHDFSWLKFFLDNVTLQVLLVSLILGTVLSKYSGKDVVIKWLSFASKYVFKALHIVMIFAPIGAFGGMAFTIGKYGIHTLLPLAKLMGTVYMTMAIFIFGVLGLILRTYKISILAYLKYIREELLDSFGNLIFRSSIAFDYGKTGKNGLLQTSCWTCYSSRIFIQSGWYYNLSFHGDNFSGPGF